ncbi:MAG: SusC/RagA family TonB-linked outer membrane protein [Gemmatimonadetes bacterium]|nr:SusC/RagA family TonB-linked outer membrane protein [Gemmatimonadota bacterium]
MISKLHSSLARALVSVGVLLLVAGAPLFAQGAVTGRVVSAEGKLPLGDVQILVEGTSIVAVTNADGRFTLRNIPVGPRELRAFRVGYTPQKKKVDIGSGQTASMDFDMIAAIVKLQEVVTTATGEQRRVELGHTVATVDVAKKMGEAPIKNFGDLLVAKAPGVQVLPANMTGGGSRVRIRGTSSISLSNDPIYIIDGIRMTSTSAGGIGVGGTAPSRVNDINPSEIENIEIVKGPSAASLYGTDAANGVIVITTKRGRAGRTNWNTFAEHGQISDPNTYPGMYALLGKTPGTTTQRRCFLREVAAGTCTVDSATSVNVYKRQDLTPIKLGARDQYGVQVNGGTEATRYFMSMDLQKETGPFGLPAFNKTRFDSMKIMITDNMRRPSQLEQGSFRTNVNASLSQNLDIGVTSAFTRLEQRLPQVDNNVNSFWYNGMVGPGFTGAGPGYTGTGSLGQPLMGYASFTPGEIFQRLATQGIQRMILGTNINWRPLNWLAARADLGMDLTDRTDYGLQRFAEGPDFGTQRQGTVTDSRGNTRNLSANLNSTMTWVPRPWLNSKLTIGTQYVNFNNYTNSAGGAILPPGAQNAGQATTPNVSQGTTLSNTLGLFAEEAVALYDRLWLTAGIRTDQNSAFGANFSRVYYPKVSASWMMSDEEWFPKKIPLLSTFRLRSAYGFAGQQPGANDALRTFATTATSIGGTDIGGLLSSALGNADIKPERTREFEGGFEAKMWDNRINFDFTYYNKKNTDQLFSLPIAGSAGTAATTILMNLGATQNTGVEFLVNAQILDSRNFGWDLTVSASKNANKLITLGKKPNGDTIPSIGVNTTVQQRNGLPIYSYWSRPYSYTDPNKDGLLTSTDIIVDTTWKPKGYSQPRDEISITNGVELFGRRLRLTALADYKGGSVLFNNEEGFLCQQSTSCPYTSSLNPSVANQARALAYRDQGTLNTAWGFMEPLQFWRLREISAVYTIPDRFAQRWFHAASANVNMAVRNIKVWTAYSGVDPEANYGQGDTQQTLLTAGPPRYVNFRLNLRY